MDTYVMLAVFDSSAIWFISIILPLDPSSLLDYEDFIELTELYQPGFKGIIHLKVLLSCPHVNGLCSVEYRRYFEERWEPNCFR